ncbi:MAG TPA: AMP-binding protein [Nitrospinota bacterium]|nr:AMP-binding protein [Nitrospinota bacterium]
MLNFPDKTACLVNNFLDGFPVAISPEGPISINKFLYDSRQLASSLPKSLYVINLCEDRYAFMVGFAAAMLCRQVTLMPHTTAPGVVGQIFKQYDGSYCLVDYKEFQEGVATHFVETSGSSEENLAEMPSFLLSQPSVITFTSGTTGNPECHEKTWGSLIRGAILAGQRFNLDKGIAHSGVATVPQQHMYGFESSIMTPLCFGGAFYSKRTFFPEDIRRAIGCLSPPRIVVTTPFHLHALIKDRQTFPETEIIISATAPLSSELASKVEDTFNTKVYEIFGFTEAGAVASRRTAESDVWKTYEGVEIIKTSDGLNIFGGHIDSPKRIPDSLEYICKNEFRLIGRNQNMVNIAGKRASLSDLNIKLNEMDGVEEGVFFVPEENNVDGKSIRLKAFAVAPRKNEKEILAMLTKVIDPVFLPRPIFLVEELPRNKTGKITRALLLQTADRLTNG